MNKYDKQTALTRIKLTDSALYSLLTCEELSQKSVEEYLKDYLSRQSREWQKLFCREVY